MSAIVVQRNIDWLTFTTKPGSPSQGLANVGGKVANMVEEQQGHERKATSWLGYDGWTIGQLFYGFRLDGGVARVSGDTAPVMGAELAESGVNGKVSRIDYAVTVRFDNDREYTAREAAEAVLASTDRKAKGRPPKLALLRGFGGGDTCSIGSRDSSRYIRIYDKTREQQNEVSANLWRYEVEYKPPLSRTLWELWLSSIDRGAIVSKMVRAELLAQGVLVPWDEGTDVKRERVVHDLTDAERKLLWLKVQVRPTVEWLVERGFGPRAMEALGLKLDNGGIVV